MKKEQSVFDLFQGKEDEHFLAGLFLTYGLDTELLEKHLLPTLYHVDIDPDEEIARFRREMMFKTRQAPIVVVADEAHYTGGKTLLYDLFLMKEVVFHPKVYVLLYEGFLRVIIGSGNLTKGGFCSNAELFWKHDINPADRPHLVEPLQKLLEWLTSQLSIQHTSAYQKIHTFLQNVQPKQPTQQWPKVVHTIGGQDILTQWTEALQQIGKKVKEVVILSPFFETDRKRAVEASLIHTFSEQMSPYMQKRGIFHFYFPGNKRPDGKWQVDVPKHLLQTLSEQIPFQVKTHIVSSVWPTSDGEVIRALHAKLLFAQFTDGTSLYLMGSPNFTYNAMRSQKDQLRNVEVGVLHYGKVQWKLPKAEEVSWSEMIVVEQEEENQPQILNFVQEVVCYLEEDHSWLLITIQKEKAPSKFSLNYQGKEWKKVTAPFDSQIIIPSFRLGLEQDIQVMWDGHVLSIPILVQNKYRFQLEEDRFGTPLSLRDILHFYAQGFRNEAEYQAYLKRLIRDRREAVPSTGMMGEFRQNMQSFFRAVDGLQQTLAEPFWDMEAFLYELHRPLGIKQLLACMQESFAKEATTKQEVFFYLLELRKSLQDVVFQEDALSVSVKKVELGKIIQGINEWIQVLEQQVKGPLSQQFKILQKHYGGSSS